MPGALFAPVRRRPRSQGSTVLPIPAAPATPSTPSPADTATAYYTRLSWVSAGATNFDVYLDTVNPPVTIVNPKMQATTYVPTLLPGKTYYWKIVAFNAGGSATGPVWSFTTPAATAVLFSLAGSIVTSRARFGSLSIHDVLNAAPNTASLTFDTSAPLAGQAVQIGLGTLDAGNLVFGGEIQSVDQTYVDTLLSTLWPVHLIDYTFRLNKRRPFGTFVNVSASIIGRKLVADFASGFTAAHVQDGLPAVSINFDGSADFMSCLTTLAQAASTTGAPVYTYVDYAKDLHLYTTETGAAPTPLTLANPPLNDPSLIAFSTDLSQVRTKVFGKGAGSTVPCDVAAGETILPLPDVSLFTAAGGRAIAATQANGAQTEILTYGGVQPGGGGSLVGPGASPSTAPMVTPAAGVGLNAGVYQYAFTDVTAAGESLPSPLATVSPFTLAAPTVAPSVTQNPADPNGTFVWNIGDTVAFKYSYSSAATGTDMTRESGASPVTTITAVQSGTSGHPCAPFIGITHDGNAHETFAHLWRSINGAAYEHIFTWTPPSNGPIQHGAFGDGIPFPSANNVFQQVAVSFIAAGVSPTTGRNLYRTPVGGSQLKLLHAFAADNTTTIFTDSTPDASLGANAPTADTSGLSFAGGQVNAGSTSLQTASAGPFPPTGGWVILSGQQSVRYTGVTGNTLTGIPASGIGSIMTTVLYGSQVLPSPALTGINSANGLVRAMVKGSAVAIWVQREDLAAQAALGLLELDEAGLPTDGIREYTITDQRYGEAGLAALCDADLALFSRPIVSVAYYTRDPNSRSGQTVAIDAALAGSFAGSFVIQDVTLTFDGVALLPRYFVRASSVKFSLMDLLRRVPLN